MEVIERRLTKETPGSLRLPFTWSERTGEVLDQDSARWLMVLIGSSQAKLRHGNLLDLQHWEAEAHPERVIVTCTDPKNGGRIWSSQTFFHLTMPTTHILLALTSMRSYWDWHRSGRKGRREYGTLLLIEEMDNLFLEETRNVK